MKRPEQEARLAKNRVRQSWTDLSTHRDDVPDDEEGDGVGALEVVEVLADVDRLVLGEEGEDERGEDPGLSPFFLTGQRGD